MRFARGDPPTWPMERKSEVQDIVQRYPESRSAVMPLFHLARSERGFIAQEDLEAVASLLGMPTAEAAAVASFYAMFDDRPAGRYLVTICMNVACHLAGADGVLAALEEALGIRAGETTPDGLITLEATSECLAACDGGPALQVNSEYFLRLNPDRARLLAAALQEGAPDTLSQLAEQEAAASVLLSARVRELTVGEADQRAVEPAQEVAARV